MAVDVVVFCDVLTIIFPILVIFHNLALMLKFTRSINNRILVFPLQSITLFKNANGLQQAPEQG